MTTQAKEPKLLTAKELADMAGIPPTALRRILRNHFNGVGKAKVKGDGKPAEYRFEAGSQTVKGILAKVKEVNQPKRNGSKAKQGSK